MGSCEVEEQARATKKVPLIMRTILHSPQRLLNLSMQQPDTKHKCAMIWAHIEEGAN